MKDKISSIEQLCIEPWTGKTKISFAFTQCRYDNQYNRSSIFADSEDLTFDYMSQFDYHCVVHGRF